MIASEAILTRDELEALYAQYAYVVDDDVDHWPDLFTDDALYKIVARENYDRGLPLATMLCEGQGMILDRVVGIRKTSVYAPRSLRHLITNIGVVAERDGGIEVRAHFAVFESLVEGPSTLHSVGRYADLVVRTPEGLRFREKVCIFDGALIQGSIIWPL